MLQVDVDRLDVMACAVGVSGASCFAVCVVIAGLFANSWNVCFAVLPVAIVVSFVSDLEWQLR
jgi:hypothetical protein